MTTQNLRDTIASLELDPEVRAKIDSLLNPLKLSADVPQNVIDQITKLLDLEIDTNELMAQAYEKTGQEIDTYLKEVDNATSDTTK